MSITTVAAAVGHLMFFFLKKKYCYTVYVLQLICLVSLGMFGA